MNALVRSVVRDTNWTMVSVAGGAALTAITFFASIKSDIRDLGTLIAENHAQIEKSDARVERLYDLLAGQSFNSFGQPKP